jgi:hypothetical protein
MGRTLPSIKECPLNSAQSLESGPKKGIGIVAALGDATTQAVGEVSGQGRDYCTLPRPLGQPGYLEVIITNATNRLISIEVGNTG